MKRELGGPEPGAGGGKAGRGDVLDSRLLKVPVESLMKKLFSRERFFADIDVGLGDKGLFERGDRGGLRLDFWLESSPDGIRVKGRMSGSIALECTRCLGEYRQEMDIRVDEFYRRPGLGAATPEGKPLPWEVEVPEEDEYLIDEGMIDLNVLVNDAVLLSLPIKRLCRTECRGICPYCGTDLNVSTCDCRVDRVDPRLEVLRQLLDGGFDRQPVD